MNSDYLPNNEYPIDEITIKTPKALQGGTYSALLEMHSNPIIIQTPKCKTKKGIHKTSKQVYCDLLFLKDNTNNINFIDWLNRLQDKVRNLILENGDNWFHENPSLDEIEYNWNDSIRTYKSNFNLIRTFILKNKNKNALNIQVFDDEENELHLENIDENKNVICILEIKGLKFSSQSFHLEIFLRQVMILNEKPLFSKCLIKQNNLEKNDKITDISKDISTTNNLTSNNTDTITNDNSNNTSTVDCTSDSITISTNDDSNNENMINDDNNDNDNDDDIENYSDVDSETNNTNDDLEKHLEKNDENTESTDDNLEKNTIIKKDNELKNLSPIDKNTLDKNNLENNNAILSEPFELQEINVNVSDKESITLKNANDVYLDIYKKAREKAKKARNQAIKAYLEVKRIKDLYMIDIVDSSDDDEYEELSE